MALFSDALTIPPAGSLNATGKGAAERQLPAAAARSVVPLVYGEDRISGLVLNVLAGAGTPGTLLVQVLWCHACDSIADVMLNDQALPAGATVTHYTGSQTVADATLVAAFAAQGISGVRPLTGYAWSLLSMPAALFDGQLNVTARVRGRRCYDPSFDGTAGGVGPQRLADPATWAYTDIPSVCLADFLASTAYGCGLAVDWASVRITSAANRTIVPGSFEQRRLVGVSFTAAAAAGDVAETLRAYAGCFLVPSSAGVKLLPDADDALVATYRHSLGQIVFVNALELRDINQAPTAVEVIYTDRSATPWRDASAIAQLDGAGTTKPWRLSQVRLPGIHRYGQALREATERLNKLNLNNLSTTLEVFDVGIRHELGDIIEVEHPIGLALTRMRVSSPPTMPAAGRWQLPLVRHSAAAYSDIVASAAAVQDSVRVVQALAAGQGGAMNADPGLLNAAGGWEWDSTITVEGPSAAPGALGVKFFSEATGTVNRFAWTRQTFPISAARTYNLSALLYAAPGNNRSMYLVVDMYKADGTQLTGADTGWGGSAAGYTFSGLPAPGQFTRYGDLFDFGAGTPYPIPASAAYFRIGVWFQYSGSGGTSSVQQAAEDIRLVDVTEARAAAVAAAAAQGTADTAAGNASSALSTLATMRSNGYLDASEKPAVIKAWQAISDEQTRIYNQGTTYGLTALRDAYSTAYTNLGTYLAGLSPSWSDTTVDTPITPATDQATWAAYYSSRQALLSAVADEAAKRADWGQVGGTAKPADNAGKVLDTRAVNDPPSAYAVGNFREFKQTASIGLSTAEAFCVVETIKGWADSSGGQATQWAYVASGEVWKRSAPTAATSWGAWVRDLDRSVYTGSLDATRNTVTYSSSAPSAPADGDIWIDTSVTPRTVRMRLGGVWQLAGTYVNGTAQLTDDANLGLTALWSGVAGTGKPDDYATRNPVYFQDADPGSVPNGSIWITSTKAWQRVAGAWQPYVGAGSVDTGELAAGAATGVAIVTFAAISFNNIA